MNIRRRRPWLAAVILMLGTASMGAAPATLPTAPGDDAQCCGPCVNCPRCHAVCKLEIKQGKEKKHTWDIECKTICIPKIRWPWKSCCDPYEARQKTVKVLVKRSYECPKCEYKWTAVECGPSCGPCTEAAPAADEAPAAEPAAPEVPKAVLQPAAPDYEYFSADRR